MTTIGELFHTLDRDAVLDAIERLYIDISPTHLRQNYERAWGEILEIQTTTTTDTVCELSLHKVIVGHADDERTVMVVMVLGRPPDDGNTDARERDDLAFMPWTKWISMQVDVLPECGNPPKVEVLAHILREMTKYGCSQKEIDRVNVMSAIPRLGRLARRAVTPFHGTHGHPAHQADETASDNTQNPLLERLELIVAGLARAEQKLNDHAATLGRIEVMLAQYVPLQIREEERWKEIMEGLSDD